VDCAVEIGEVAPPTQKKKSRKFAAVVVAFMIAATVAVANVKSKPLDLEQILEEETGAASLVDPGRRSLQLSSSYVGVYQTKKSGGRNFKGYGQDVGSEMEVYGGRYSGWARVWVNEVGKFVRCYVRVDGSGRVGDWSHCDYGFIPIEIQSAQASFNGNVMDVTVWFKFKWPVCWWGCSTNSISGRLIKA